MNITDILILIGILAYIILGFRDGFFKKIFAVTSFWAGLILGTIFMDDGGKIISSWFDISIEVASIIAFFLIFLFIVICQMFIYKWIGKTADGAISFLSRLTGAILGAIQGAIAISLVLILFDIFDTLSKESKSESILYSKFYYVAPVIFNHSTTWLPESKSFLDFFNEQFENLKSSEK